MVFKFTVLSDEVDDFVRVITIDSESSFFDFHDAILNSVKYEKNQITSFFLCSDEWEKEQEVTLVEMESSSEYDNLVMSETPLEDLLTDEKQKLLYIFDLVGDRAFFIELTEMIPGKKLSVPKCISAEGNPPEQMSSEDIFMPVQKITMDENFYGDEDYDIEELDEEGFGDMNFDDSSLYSEDSQF